MRPGWRRGIVGCALLMGALSGLACSDSAPAPDAVPATAQETPSAAPGYLLFNQRIVEGQRTEGVDLSQPEAVFARVFAGLPDEVTVYPSENYYYFVLHIGGRQIWGNIRLAAGSREKGLLSFGYFEFDEFPTGQRQTISGSKFLSAADGVTVEEVDRFTYAVIFGGKRVIFHLHELEQTPPVGLVLAADERFIERTFDESGYRFALIFNEEDNYFLWVLDEDEPVPDVLDPLGADLVAGRRSGFVFWIDRANGARKVLAGVRQLNVSRNDYYDGPFDQLADNYADAVGISAWIQRAYPALEGRIDKYGYYIDRDPPLRVALSTYYVYTAQSEMLQFLALALEDADPRAFISRAGRPAEALRPGQRPVPVPD